MFYGCSLSKREKCLTRATTPSFKHPKYDVLIQMIYDLPLNGIALLEVNGRSSSTSLCTEYSTRNAVKIPRVQTL
jgi:hypothetical protein